MWRAVGWVGALCFHILKPTTRPRTAGPSRQTARPRSPVPLAPAALRSWPPASARAVRGALILYKCMYTCMYVYTCVFVYGVCENGCGCVGVHRLVTPPTPPAKRNPQTRNSTSNPILPAKKYHTYTFSPVPTNIKTTTHPAPARFPSGGRPARAVPGPCPRRPRSGGAPIDCVFVLGGEEFGLDGGFCVCMYVYAWVGRYYHIIVVSRSVRF